MARRIGITHERVLAVATELADEHGLDRLTLAQIAGRLGIRLPSLYNHVDGLPGLQRELALFGCRKLLDRLSRAAIGKASDVALIAIAQAYRSFVVEHPGLYAATVRAPAPDDHELQQVSDEIIVVVLAVLQPYGLADQAAIHAVRGLRSICHGFATLEVAGGFGMPLDRDESFLRLLHAYISGLHADGEAKHAARR